MTYVSKGPYRYIPMTYYDSLADAKRTLRENSLTALEFQTDLLEFLGRASSVPAYQHFMRSYGYKKLEHEEERATLGQFLHDSVQDVVQAASTFYVSPDMCELVKMAAEDMPQSGLRPTDMPTDTGFLVFDRPVPLTSVVYTDPSDGTSSTESEIRITAIAWQAGQVRQAPNRPDDPDMASIGKIGSGPTVPGIAYYLFTTAHDMAVCVNQGLQENGDEDFVTEDDVRRGNGPLPIYDFSGWSFNSPWHPTAGDPGYAVADGDGASEPVHQVHAIVDQARRLMLATWRILNQTNIVVLDPNRVPRQLRRRAERVGIIPENGDIVIIRMRREIFQGLKKATNTEGDDDVPWYTCRFMVRGHWHHYWVGPRGGQTLIEKYLLPYEKGPEGAPLVHRDKIFSLER